MRLRLQLPFTIFNDLFIVAVGAEISFVHILSVFFINRWYPLFLSMGFSNI